MPLKFVFFFSVFIAICIWHDMTLDGSKRKENLVPSVKKTRSAHDGRGRFGYSTWAIFYHSAFCVWVAERLPTWTVFIRRRKEIPLLVHFGWFFGSSIVNSANLEQPICFTIVRSSLMDNSIEFHPRNVYNIFQQQTACNYCGIRKTGTFGSLTWPHYDVFRTDTHRLWRSVSKPLLVNALQPLQSWLSREHSETPRCPTVIVAILCPTTIIVASHYTRGQSESLLFPLRFEVSFL